MMLMMRNSSSKDYISCSTAAHNILDKVLHQKKKKKINHHQQHHQISVKDKTTNKEN